MFALLTQGLKNDTVLLFSLVMLCLIVLLSRFWPHFFVFYSFISHIETQVIVLLLQQSQVGRKTIWVKADKAGMAILS